MQYDYSYNGNENVNDLDINLMDFNARWYDSAIARFTSVDPLADIASQVNKSPFAYSWNNPVTLNDLGGSVQGCPARNAQVRGLVNGIGKWHW